MERGEGPMSAAGQPAAKLWKITRFLQEDLADGPKAHSCYTIAEATGTHFSYASKIIKRLIAAGAIKKVSMRRFHRSKDKNPRGLELTHDPDLALVKIAAGEPPKDAQTYICRINGEDGWIPVTWSRQNTRFERVQIPPVKVKPEDLVEYIYEMPEAMRFPIAVKELTHVDAD